MIKIETSLEVKGKCDVSISCKAEMEGMDYVLVSELAAILSTIEENRPGMIGEALQFMIDKETGRR